MASTIPYVLVTNLGGVASVVANRWVQIKNNSSGTTYTSSSATDANGRCAILGVPPGIYTVYASNDGITYNSTTETNFIVPYTTNDPVDLLDQNQILTGDKRSTKLIVLDKLPGAPAVSTPTDVSTGKIWDWGGAVYNAKAAGLVGNGQTVTDGAITSGQANLTSASGLFVSTDAGKPITVQGAGAAAGVLITTIAAYVSPTQVTLAANAGTTVTAARVDWGTDDLPAFRTLVALVQTAGGGEIYFPDSSGFYWLYGSVTDGTNTWQVSVSGDRITFRCGPNAKVVTSREIITFAITGAIKPAGDAGNASHGYVGSGAPAIYAINGPVAKAVISLTTTTASDAGNFAPGDWIYIRTGETLALSAANEPDSELNQVITANAGTGVITLRWPTAKPYAQEYWQTGPVGPTDTVNHGAGTAPFGISKVTDRTAQQIAFLRFNFESTAITSPYFAGGQLYGFRIEDCRGQLAGPITSMQSYRGVREARNDIRSTGDNVYFFASGTGSVDVEMDHNVCSSGGVCIVHIHEGCAQVRSHDNQWLNRGGTGNGNVISIRARAYDIEIDDFIVNASTDAGTPAVYVDPACGGPGMGGRIRVRGSGIFGIQGFVQVSPATGWAVEPIRVNGTNPNVSVALGNVWDQAELWIPAQSMLLQGQAPVLATVAAGRFNAWKMRHSFTDSVEGAVRLPRDWLGYSITIYWISDAGGAGNVRWLCYGLNMVLADDLSTSTSFTQAAATGAAAGQNILSKTLLAPNITAGVPSEGTVIQFQRDGTNAADTLVGLADIIGAMIRRTA